MFDIAIIGAGPAGLTAGIYARRAGYSVAIFEMAVPGGQAATTDFVENFPGFPGGINGAELMMKFYEQAAEFGAELIYDQVENLELAGVTKIIRAASGTTYEAKVVVYATGAHPRMLGLEKEDAFRGKGVSYCATCDGFFFRDKDVAVIGGGDVAVEEALYLTKMCKSVTLFHRRDELRANRRSQELALSNDKLKIVWDSIAVELLGDDRMEQLISKNVKTGELTTWNFDGSFIFVGYDPNAELIVEELTTDDRGYIITNEEMATNLKGVYAIGDVRHKLVRQIGTAVGDASIVMHDIERYFREEVNA